VPERRGRGGDIKFSSCINQEPWDVGIYFSSRFTNRPCRSTLPLQTSLGEREREPALNITTVQRPSTSVSFRYPGATGKFSINQRLEVNLAEQGSVCQSRNIVSARIDLDKLSTVPYRVIWPQHREIYPALALTTTTRPKPHEFFLCLQPRALVTSHPGIIAPIRGRNITHKEGPGVRQSGGHRAFASFPREEQASSGLSPFRKLGLFPTCFIQSHNGVVTADSRA
jgi:hypothetical protein